MRHFPIKLLQKMQIELSFLEIGKMTHGLGNITDVLGKKKKTNKQIGFHRMNVILHSKGNSQQSEEVT